MEAPQSPTTNSNRNLLMWENFPNSIHEHWEEIGKTPITNRRSNSLGTVVKQWTEKKEDWFDDEFLKLEEPFDKSDQEFSEPSCTQLKKRKRANENDEIDKSFHSEPRTLDSIDLSSSSSDMIYLPAFKMRNSSQSNSYENVADAMTSTRTQQQLTKLSRDICKAAKELKKLGTKTKDSSKLLEPSYCKESTSSSTKLYGTWDSKDISGICVNSNDFYLTSQEYNEFSEARNINSQIDNEFDPTGCNIYFDSEFVKSEMYANFKGKETEYELVHLNNSSANFAPQTPARKRWNTSAFKGAHGKFPVVNFHKDLGGDKSRDCDKIHSKDLEADKVEEPLDQIESEKVRIKTNTENRFNNQNNRKLSRCKNNDCRYHRIRHLSKNCTHTRKHCGLSTKAQIKSSGDLDLMRAHLYLLYSQKCLEKLYNSILSKDCRRKTKRVNCCYLDSLSSLERDAVDSSINESTLDAVYTISDLSKDTCSETYFPNEPVLLSYRKADYLSHEDLSLVEAAVQTDETSVSVSTQLKPDVRCAYTQYSNRIKHCHKDTQCLAHSLSVCTQVRLFDPKDAVTQFPDKKESSNKHTQCNRLWVNKSSQVSMKWRYPYYVPSGQMYCHQRDVARENLLDLRRSEGYLNRGFPLRVHPFIPFAKEPNFMLPNSLTSVLQNAVHRMDNAPHVRVSTEYPADPRHTLRCT